MIHRPRFEARVRTDDLSVCDIVRIQDHRCGEPTETKEFAYIPADAAQQAADALNEAYEFVWQIIDK